MTETIVCVHRMPCGLCELTKKACAYGNAITLTPGIVPYKIEPSWNEVTCSAERDEE